MRYVDWDWRRGRRRGKGRLPVAILLMATGTLWASQGDVEHLRSMSIQELLEVPVTTVSRRPQKYADAAAALFVISREDIRRSGATNVPELLRMVPGVQVARIDASKWAISARGFNGRYANKLLVQMDGRTLYTPLYSGVYWDVQDTLLEDVERIEVIRGPGATLWGANAVNGIINIITRSAYETESALLSAGLGDEERAVGAFRYGSRIGDAASFRVYAKGFERDGGRYFSGEQAPDDASDRRVGFRADLDASQADSLTLQGDYYEGAAGAAVAAGPVRLEAASETSGANLLARWSRRLGADAAMELQFYYDHSSRSNWSLHEERDTYDLDFQHHFTAGGNHALVWGAGYRLTRDDIRKVPGSPPDFHPARRDAATFSAFVQDDISLLDGSVHLIVGSKLEHNDYTGWEVQPNVRGLWNLETGTTLWASVSRAVRTPSRLESDVTIVSDPLTHVIQGNPDMRAERLNAYELGLRMQPLGNLSLDLAAFYNDYDHLQTYEPDGPFFPPPFTLVFDNGMRGSSHGLELAVNWDVSRNWRLKAAYSHLKMDLEPKPGSRDPLSPQQWDRAPEDQFSLRSLLDLGEDWELDGSLYYVGALPHTEVSSYWRLDLRLGWHPLPGLELSLLARNLLDDGRPEFVEFSGNAPGTGLISTREERTFLLQATWRP